MNMEKITILASYISGLSVVFPLKHVMPQLHSLNIFSLIIELLQPVFILFVPGNNPKEQKQANAWRDAVSIAS